jgi:hypothetical protein
MTETGGIFAMCLLMKKRALRVFLICVGMTVI